MIAVSHNTCEKQVSEEWPPLKPLLNAQAWRIFLLEVSPFILGRITQSGWIGIISA